MSAQSSHPHTPEGFVHRHALVDGLRLHYVEGGRADAPPLLLLAGFPESWYAWRHVLPLLAPHHRLLAPDLPGQGDSDRPLEGYDTAALANALHALVRKLGWGRHAVVGHDVGAWVAYAYAGMFAADVERLALIDAGIPGATLPDALPSAPEVAWKTWHFAFHALPDLPEALLAGRERLYLEWFLKRKAADPGTFSAADIDEYLRGFAGMGALRAGLGYYRAAGRSAEQNRERARAGKLAVPLLAISADQGSIRDMAAPLRACFEHVEAATIADCGHYVPEEQPGALAGLLRDFLERPLGA
ncbi:alpha/beta fold hydrolase [[Pseudomonas] boreopolis]|uniref:alpha/beta fold hydrolase n=1 Tax=Xanthomonas boreopolis TaxID=86183 RepID=UPI003DA021E3